MSVCELCVCVCRLCVHVCHMHAFPFNRNACSSICLFVQVISKRNAYKPHSNFFFAFSCITCGFGQKKDIKQLVTDWSENRLVCQKKWKENENHTLKMAKVAWSLMELGPVKSGGLVRRIKMLLSYHHGVLSCGMVLINIFDWIWIRWK